MKRTLTMLAVLLISTQSTLALETLQGPAKTCPLKTLKDGKSLSLESLKGKVVYLDFWASWCGPCALSFPFMSEVAKKHKAEGLELVAISVDESREEAEAFLSTHPTEVTIVHDPNGDCPKAYGLETMPTSYLIDRKGNLREVHRGFSNSDRQELSKAIDSLLKEKP
jgi:thiol-disulfide isomerase/thioredoxin